MGKNSRQKLRPWLEGILNEGNVPGVIWLDKSKQTFKIPWPHGGKQSGDDNTNREMFKKWAIQTGRFREGIDKLDYVLWKTRLRCAINKAKEIEELNNESRNDDFDPYKVYCFTDLKGCDGKEQTKNREENEADTFVINVHEYNVPSDKQNNDPKDLPSDLESLKTSDLMQLDVEFISDKMDSVQIENSGPSNGFDIFLKITFDDVVKFEEKLNKKSFNFGFLIGCDDFVNSLDPLVILNLSYFKAALSNLDKVQKFPELICGMKLVEEFYPGLMIKPYNNDILVCSFKRAPLFYVDSFNNLMKIECMKETVVLKNQDKPNEWSRQVVIKSPSDNVSITIRTELPGETHSGFDEKEFQDLDNFSEEKNYFPSINDENMILMCPDFVSQDCFPMQTYLDL